MVMFMIFLGFVLVTICSLGWRFLVTGFPKYKKWKWLLLWLLVSALAVGFFLFVQGKARAGIPIDFWLRQGMIKFFSFWMIFQVAMLVFFPVWSGIAFSRWVLKNKGQANEGLFQKIGMVFVILALGISLKVGIFPDSWRVVEVEIASPEIPAGLNGLRIAQISDTHVIYPEDVDQVKAQIEAAKVGKADLLFFTGDLADTTALIPNTVTVFKEAEKDFPLGVWFVLGNHEYFQGLPLFMAEFEKQKVRLLRNEGATLSYQGTSFYLGGVDYPWKGNVFSRDGGGASFDMAAAESDLDRVLSRKPADLYMVLGAHHPGAFDLSFDKKVGLTLSGHTHASQVGFGGRSLNPFVKYNWGLYGKDGFWGYVTSGAGEWFPIRFGAQEEVVIFTLRRTSR